MARAKVKFCFHSYLNENLMIYDLISGFMTQHNCHQINKHYNKLNIIQTLAKVINPSAHIRNNMKNTKITYKSIVELNNTFRNDTKQMSLMVNGLTGNVKDEIIKQQDAVLLKLAQKRVKEKVNTEKHCTATMKII